MGREVRRTRAMTIGAVSVEQARNASVTMKKIHESVIDNEEFIVETVIPTTRGATVEGTVYVRVQIDGKFYEADRVVRLALKPRKPE